MSRPAVVAALAIATAGSAVHARAAIQIATPASWSYNLDTYTIYGHTTYRETVVLLPRVVYDTARAVDSALVVDSVRTAAVVAGGLAAGLFHWPTDRFCAGPASATALPIEPWALLGRVQAAARCGVRLVIVPPRRLLAADGRSNGLFSVDSAKRLIDRYAAALPPDTLGKYARTTLGLNLGDDYRCMTCWGGSVITQTQIAAWAAYAHTHLPGLPLGVRITPNWVSAYPTLAQYLDYTWAQYNSRQGDPQAYFDAAAEGAAKLGLRVVMGLNVEDCSGGGTAPCTAAELAKYGSIAATHPGSCAFISWQYDETTWASPDIRAAWDTLLAAAKGRAGRECRRA